MPLATIFPAPGALCLATLMVWPWLAMAQIADSDQPKITVRGASPSGCDDSVSKHRQRLSGNWMALTDHPHQPTIRTSRPWVENNQVLSRRQDEYYFFKNIALKPGPLNYASWQARPIGTTARKEFDITLGKARYRFITWGVESFALQAVLPNGTTRLISIHGDTDGKIPNAAYASSRAPEASDEGETGIAAIADFNGDGMLDILLSGSWKEAEVLILWLSDPVSRRHGIPISSATNFGDCPPE